MRASFFPGGAERRGRSATETAVQDARPDLASRSTTARTWTWIAAGSCVSVLVRLRMLWTPLSVDEGGYLAVARAWAHGKVLYRDVWLDRPQGLLLLFRAWDWASGGSTASVRIMAMLFGILLVVATSVLVRELIGAHAARATAVVCGVITATPVLEGHTANGELLAGAVSAAGLAVAAMAFNRPRPLRWFFAAGALAGAAMSLKQSGFDGLVTVGTFLVVAAVLAPRHGRRIPLRALAAVGAGLVTVLAALALHGATLGWSRWWTAVAGYRLRVESGISAAGLAHLHTTYPFALAALGAATLAAGVGATVVVVGVRRRRVGAPGPALMLPIWTATSIAAFIVGGGFWRHYWLLLAAPLSALAGVAISRAPRWRSVLLLLVVAPCLVASGWVVTARSPLASVRAGAGRRPALDRRVASWWSAHHRPGDQLYVLCASAALYATAHQDPGYRYLWLTEVRNGPNALRLLVDYLGDDRQAPRYVAQYQSISVCDPSGAVAGVFAAKYHLLTHVGEIGIFERDA